MSSKEVVILTPDEMADVTEGFWTIPVDDLEIYGVCIPPDKTHKGYLAIAVTPDKWKNLSRNTHENIPRMIQKGVAAVLVDLDWYEKTKESFTVPLLVVKDTYLALRNIATASRDKSLAKRILVTGTEGKTSTKYTLNELIGKQASSYAQETSANLTVPILISMSCLKASNRYTIIEVSCPQPNRCTERSKLIQPDIAIITNLNISHMNTHGSIDNLIKHKLESLDGLKENGVFIINKSTDLYEQFMQRVKAEKPGINCKTYGRTEDCTAFIVEQKFEDFGWNIKANIDGTELSYRINRVQEHTPLGSLPVLLAMKLLGLDLDQGAKDFADNYSHFDSMGILKKLSINSGSFLFYDQHFSITETALKSALQDVKRMPVKGKKIVVISGELNSAKHAQKVHERIATYIDDTDIDILYTIGEYMDITVDKLTRKECFRGHFFTVDLLIGHLLEVIEPDDLLFIKGMTKLNFRAISEAVQNRFLPVARDPGSTKCNSEELDICFVGDTYFGEWHMARKRAKGDPDLLEERGYLGFAEKLNPLLCASDFVVANLECAITDREKPSFAKEKVHVYAARREQTIEALKASNIQAVILANNHAGDYGKEGILDTLEALEEAGIHPIGAGRNSDEAANPFIYTNPKIPEFRMGIVSAYNMNPKNQSYGFYAEKDKAGVHLMDLDQLQHQAAKIRQNDPELFLILSPHWGANFIWRPNVNRQRAKKITSTDFDIIVGHSAHMLQEIEYVNNKLVLYSLGNFILNGGGEEYRNKNLPPFSFIARLHVQKDDKGISKELYVYPFICDNSATNYQPRFVTKEEFGHVEMIIKSHQYMISDNSDQARKGVDKFGHFFRYSV